MSPADDIFTGPGVEERFALVWSSSSYRVEHDQKYISVLIVQ